MWEFYEQAMLGRQFFSQEAWLYAYEIWKRQDELNHYYTHRQATERIQRLAARRKAFRERIASNKGACEGCGAIVEWNTHGRLRRFCTRACYQKWADRRKSEAAAAARAARPPCPTCGAPVIGGNALKVFCSKRCRPSKVKPCSGLTRSEIARAGWERRRRSEHVQSSDE